MYITRLAANEIFSPSNKIQREVGRAKDLSAPRYDLIYNTDTHIQHKDRLRNFLVRQFVCRWQWNGWGTKKLAQHHVMNTTNIHRQLIKVNIKECVY